MLRCLSLPSRFTQRYRPFIPHAPFLPLKNSIYKHTLSFRSFCTSTSPPPPEPDKTSPFRMGRIRQYIEKVIVRKTSTQSSKIAVKFALTGNILNTLGKFTAFIVTGSGTMLSESLHSLADVANQSLLLIGVKRSQRPPTQDYPYGFEGERFVYALISATGIFFIGACFSAYHGIYHILHPAELDNLWLAICSLLFSGSIEFVSFSIGVLAVKQGARENGVGFFEFLRKGNDPMAVAVVMEDGAALLGLGMASICLSLAFFTGNPVFDAIGTLLIATLLGNIAIFLIIKNAKSLSSRAAPIQKRARIVKLLMQDPAVQSLHQVKAIQVGENAISFSAEVEFDGNVLSKKYLESNNILEQIMANKDNSEKIEQLLIGYGSGLIAALGDEVDRIEHKIKQQVPEAKYVDLESN